MEDEDRGMGNGERAPQRENEKNIGKKKPSLFPSLMSNFITYCLFCSY